MENNQLKVSSSSGTTIDIDINSELLKIQYEPIKKHIKEII
jgi:hypothetical protein